MAGTFSRVKTWGSGDTLTAADLNAEFDNVLNNSDPDGIDDASANATAMQATADPYPAASESLATDLRGELQRIRYIIKQITGEANWYVDPDTTIVDLQRETHRAKFVSTSDTVITIGPGTYHHNGTTLQNVYWNSDITFTVGSGGSNAASEDLGASEWHYIYLDDSAIVTQGAALIDAGCFLNNTTAPTWSDTKHGWYSGSDRCIFGFYSDSDSDIRLFLHDGGDFVFNMDVSDTRGIAALSTASEVVTMFLPGFATRGRAHFGSVYVDADAALRWRPKDNDNFVATVCTTRAGGTRSNNTSNFITNGSQQIEIDHDAAGTNNAYVFSEGWYFPTGM